MEDTILQCANLFTLNGSLWSIIHVVLGRISYVLHVLSGTGALWVESFFKIVCHEAKSTWDSGVATLFSRVVFELWIV